MPQHILVVDDEAAIADLVEVYLTNEGFDVHKFAAAAPALEYIKGRSSDLALLDVMLPDMDGFALCQKLREASTVPVIFASARTSEDDRITGLDLGGDDYLPKPYSMKELLSRVNALIRRTYEFMEQDNIVQFGDVVVNISSRTVQKQGDIISLSLKEFDLLACLCQHRNHAVPKEKIINEVWGDFSIAEPSTLTVHIRWLREKIENDPANPQYIKTVYKVGYMLEAAG